MGILPLREDLSVFVDVKKPYPAMMPLNFQKVCLISKKLGEKNSSKERVLKKSKMANLDSQKLTF